MKKNHILLHINLASGLGGGEVQTLNLMGSIKNYEQLCLSKKNKPFQLRCLETYPNVKQISIWKTLQYAIKKRGSLIIHCHDGRGVHLGGILKCLFGCKLVITRRMDKKIKKNKLSRRAYYKSDKVIALSLAVKKSLDFLKDEVVIIPDSYSKLPESNEENERLNQFGDKFIVSHIANVLPIKNHKLTLEIARKITNKNILFLIVGDGPELFGLKDEYKHLDNVVFWGHTPYISNILKRTNVIILPSFSEGLGSIILEGYRYGIPAVASNVGGIPDILINNKTGFLIEKNDVDSYITAIERIYSDRNITQMFRCNISAIVDKYSPEAIAEKYMSIYRSL
ncbi:TPA: glycosyltransferase family 4 protein [Photobacterium damselae]